VESEKWKIENEKATIIVLKMIKCIWKAFQEIETLFFQFFVASHKDYG
jgi:hypothetical protein